MSPTNPIDLCFLPATELAARIRRRDISPVEVVETYLRRIEERNPAINAYTLVLGEQAVEAARAAEAAVMAGQPLGPLHGVPIAVIISPERWPAPDCRKWSAKAKSTRSIPFGVRLKMRVTRRVMS